MKYYLVPLLPDLIAKGMKLHFNFLAKYCEIVPYCLLKKCEIAPSNVKYASVAMQTSKRVRNTIFIACQKGAKKYLTA